MCNSHDSNIIAPAEQYHVSGDTVSTLKPGDTVSTLKPGDTVSTLKPGDTVSTLKPGDTVSTLKPASLSLYTHGVFEVAAHTSNLPVHDTALSW